MLRLVLLCSVAPLVEHIQIPGHSLTQSNCCINQRSSHFDTWLSTTLKVERIIEKQQVLFRQPLRPTTESQVASIGLGSDPAMHSTSESRSETSRIFARMNDVTPTRNPSTSAIEDEEELDDLHVTEELTRGNRSFHRRLNSFDEVLDQAYELYFAELDKNQTSPEPTPQEVMQPAPVKSSESKTFSLERRHGGSEGGFEEIELTDFNAPKSVAVSSLTRLIEREPGTNQQPTRAPRAAAKTPTFWGKVWNAVGQAVDNVLGDYEETMQLSRTSGAAYGGQLDR